MKTQTKTANTPVDNKPQGLLSIDAPLAHACRVCLVTNNPASTRMHQRRGCFNIVRFNIPIPAKTGTLSVIPAGTTDISNTPSYLF